MAGSFMIAIAVLVFAAANSAPGSVSSSSSSSRHPDGSHHLVYEKSLKDLVMDLEADYDDVTTSEMAEMIHEDVVYHRAKAERDRDTFSLHVAALQQPSMEEFIHQAGHFSTTSASSFGRLSRVLYRFFSRGPQRARSLSQVVILLFLGWATRLQREGRWVKKQHVAALGLFLIFARCIRGEFPG